MSSPRSPTRRHAAGGIYHTHVRYPLGDRFLDPFREAIEIGRRGEGPSHITHFYHRATHPGPPERLLALVDDARAEGMDVTFDMYPSEWASPACSSSCHPGSRRTVRVPSKERLADRGRPRPAPRRAARARRRLRLDRGLGRRAPRRLHRSREPALGGAGPSPTSCATRATTRSTCICDLLLAEHLGVMQVTSGPWTDGIRRFLRHPGAMIGTDSTFFGAKPAPRTYGSYPRVLGQFVRDEGLLTPRGRRCTG